MKYTRLAGGQLLEYLVVGVHLFDAFATTASRGTLGGNGVVR